MDFICLPLLMQGKGLNDFLSLGFLSSLGLAPLCENMPSGKATKPGDVVTAKNGKTIQVGGHTMRC